MGSPSVNTQAQAAEQSNQVQGQQYAQQQQQAALAGLANWNKANPSPVSTAPALKPPTASSPATMGGGVVQPQAQPMKPQGQPPMPGTAPQGAPAGGAPGLSPQIRQALIAALSGQGAK
jgi:hypothetical protein